MSFGNPLSSKSRRWRFALAATMTGALLATTTVAASASAQPGPPENPGKGSGIVDEIKRKIYVKKTLRSMTLEEKVGQLFMPYVYGQTSDTTNPADVAANQALHGVDNGDELMEVYNPGGIIYFAWSNNVDNPNQIAGLSNGLQMAATNTGPEVPLLISTDQEHGRVARVTDPATQFPGAMALGATHDPQAAYSAADIAGLELGAVGINQNFAPVADVNVNPNNPVIGIRSFSSDPHLTADMVSAQVTGYQEGSGGIAAAAKHFPGHGNTDVDSHYALPVIPHTYEEWQQYDAPPFEAAIADGIDVIMTAHIQFPALDDSGRPATLSQPIMTDLLRDQLGFEGLIMSDSLAMEGVREDFTDEEVPVYALQAGVDMLLMPPDTELAFNAVLDAIAEGELTESRIDESVKRVLSLKHKRGIVADPFVDEDAVDDIVGIPSHRELAADLSAQTTTLVQNDGTLPLDAAAGLTTLVTGNGASAVESIAQQLGDRGYDATSLHTGTAPGQEDIDAAVAAAAESDLVVLTTTGVNENSGQLPLIEALLASDTPVVAIGTGTPYDIAHYPQVEAYVATYGTTGDSLTSLVQVLFNESPPIGALPVTIPVADDEDTALFEIGHGLGY
ncbi:glycoside hydrolase family 3 protein [Natronoglycomyces albus]|uniref:beta-N-acetylhexosaminidase n=1 Tax=Natronoglycomyces albus TaxID=2811108 RepID=A0A895XEU7_9ACTN|nr:glycoside hydrolase family 3 protein [Natronoglycomyces albus]QSB04361.1 glycoside hydrolase family 3 C-terminal domain-containing protein [Natronoglycomyces albus]